MSALVYLLLAGLAGLVAGWFRGAGLPYAVAVCALAALILSVTVSLPLGDQGPHLFEVALVPAAAAALGGALLARAMLEFAVRRWRAEA
jgi:hypothetical protein